MVYKVSRITSKVLSSALVCALKALSLAVKVFAFACEGLAAALERTATTLVFAVGIRCRSSAFAFFVALLGVREVVFKGVRT